jgi:hypothetical protein
MIEACAVKVSATPRLTLMPDDCESSALGVAQPATVATASFSVVPVCAPLACLASFVSTPRTASMLVGVGHPEQTALAS